MKRFLVTILASIYSLLLCADEGMWLTNELNRESIARMKELGFSFPIDSIYSETNPSLKDAVIIWDNGCTGVMVSDKGLVFTNHHCGYDAIQKLSSVEHDYLKDGFVSQSFREELPAPGITVSFLDRMDDITEYITSFLDENDDEITRLNKVDSISNLYLKNLDNNNGFMKAEIVPFYNQNKYYLVTYKVFKDIRLVFAPPSSVGNFGGETDNWMWPRHTGDFSVFRIYADNNNNPAYYQESNIPYTPKYHVPISLKGYDEKDFAMTIGYPARTQRYISSFGIQQMIGAHHNPMIKVRGAKQEIWKKAMNENDTIRIKYATKYAMSSNYWKNAIGMDKAIYDLDIINERNILEYKFSEWVKQKEERTAKYGETLYLLQDNYIFSFEKMKNETYFTETFFNGIEIIKIAYLVEQLILIDNPNIKDVIRNMLIEIFKDYDPSLDQKVMAELLKVYKENVIENYLPSIYEEISNEFNDDSELYANWLFSNSKLTDKTELFSILEKDTTNYILSDPAIVLCSTLTPIFLQLREELETHELDIEKGYRLLMAGLMEMQPEKTFYPDANNTQRLSYGSIEGYSPSDSTHYNYFTTIKGILEKEDKNNPEFVVQDYILNHLRSNNFNEYCDKDGEMHVNFLSNNDIAGGNSGSPVLNEQAHLIGLAFDGNWEALSSDVAYSPELQRCINVDIRYVLFMIEKVGKCSRLIEELDIIK